MAPHVDEWLKCSLSFPYWLDSHGTLYDATRGAWMPFRLWPQQVAVAGQLPRGRLFVILKARQLGLTWLTVGYALWLMLFRPAATCLLFSRRDDEAVHLLKVRLRGMYDRLPAWMQARAIEAANDHTLRLSNGSAALAFPTTGGRSYTATLALVDEADHTGDLDRLLDAVKPTVDAGGWLILLSTADKARPGTAFKRIYTAARAGRNDYTPIFLPWDSRPDRTRAWYEAIARDFLERDGALDSLYGEYPATDVEALAGRTLDRRFAPDWLAAAFSDPPSAIRHLPSATCHPAPALGPGFTVFVPPGAGRSYVIGADPAEGNPQSDESAASVVDAMTGEQVAVLAGRLEPRVFAASLAQLSEYYNSAAMLVERNNHGHAVLLWLAEFGRTGSPELSGGLGAGRPGAQVNGQPFLPGLEEEEKMPDDGGLRLWSGTLLGPELGTGCAGQLLRGPDGRPGWLSSGRGKVLAFDAAAEALREGQTVVRDRVTLDQLMEIRGATLSAPEGQRDDRAVAHVLALAALRWCEIRSPGSGKSVIIPPRPVISADETGGW